MRAAVESQARYFESQDDRDAFLEQTYTYDRSGYPNTLAFVAGEQEPLVRAFHASWEGIEDDPKAALLRFEVDKFGAALEPQAHGILAFAVKRSMRKGVPELRRAKVPPRKEGEPSLEYLVRICRANGWPAAPAAEVLRSMPHPRLEEAS